LQDLTPDIYHLDELAVEGETVSNEQMDREVYGL
jgi:hypothetical protein